MLADKDAMATIAVKSLAVARKFYEGKLGLKKASPEEAAAATYGSGGSTLVVYQSEYAGTNKATAVGFDVPLSTFDDEVGFLREKGVSFLTFDLEGAEWNEGVASGEGMKAVWFTDPDGNILNISAGAM